MSSIPQHISPASPEDEETVPCPQLEPGALYRLRRGRPWPGRWPESVRVRVVDEPIRGVFRTYEEMVGMPDVDAEGEISKLATDDMFMFVEAKRCVELNCCCYHVLTKNGPGWIYVFCDDHNYLLFEKVTA